MNTLTAITPAVSQPAPAALVQIERKAEEFEALILAQLLKPMFESVKTPSLMGGGEPEQDAFNTMLHDEYAKALAARGGVGIADQVKDALIRLQSNISTIQGTPS